MPRENINSDDENAATRVEVCWQPGRSVQVTTALREDIPCSSEAPAHTRYTPGTYVSIDRAGINRLIRALRRARDAVFGKDA